MNQDSSFRQAYEAREKILMDEAAKFAHARNEGKNERAGMKILGVDLGLKVPAVAITDDDKVRFFGNGRQNKYRKRKFRSVRKKLGKDKKVNAIRRFDDKEQRWMQDKNHKISREIIDFAIANHISVIRLEQLTNIRQTARTSRKNEKNLHAWSFYRLSRFIAYTATLVGIQVEYVNPAYTSQSCPKCAEKNKGQDRKYKCPCGLGHIVISLGR